MAASKFTEAEKDSALALLQSLLRIDTTNPPGNEGPATDAVASFCRGIDLEPAIVSAGPGRPNLVARWSAAPENKTGRPIILSCHLDVVPADPARWTHPPFSGYDDGTHLWGRGAIDMKGFAAMALASLAKLKSENTPINRDVLFVAVCDEEAGAKLGSEWLVDEHPDLLGGNPEFVLNEVGGFTVHRKGRRFYPVQVAEKGIAWLRLTVFGKPGHSSLPASDSSILKLARAIEAIGSAKLPWHAGVEARRFIRGFAAPEGRLAEKVSTLLANPMIGPKLLPLAVRDPSRRASLEAILRNTATPTRLRGAAAVNALPGSAAVDLDGRLAPGQTAADLIRELTRVLGPAIGDDFRFEILRESPAVGFSTDTPLYRHIEEALRRADPEARVVPSIIPGFTDSGNYARLGAQCYGFYPLRLPPDLDFAALFHGDDERIPIAGFHWGVETLTDMLRVFLTEEPTGSSA
ncbi:MAG: M20/M25/M40 family metallo-hydrolase [Verrucomicrobiales bacterium]